MKDIYGGDYSLLGLPGDVPASSFGKAARSSKEDMKGMYIAFLYKFFVQERCCHPFHYIFWLLKVEKS